ncbi:hypothetical protein FKP32DRAFT_1598753 [Trametes sanguinea]|nr:hypothetical protein FKP32DRAFT_1598753 [Trametes sanguinea]
MKACYPGPKLQYLQGRTVHMIQRTPVSSRLEPLKVQPSSAVIASNSFCKLGCHIRLPRPTNRHLPPQKAKCAHASGSNPPTSKSQGSSRSGTYRGQPVTVCAGPSVQDPPATYSCQVRHDATTSSNSN